MEKEKPWMWTQFFCAVKGWQYHPGTKEKLSTETCAKIADQMLAEYEQRFGEKQCPGL